MGSPKKARLLTQSVMSPEKFPPSKSSPVKAPAATPSSSRSSAIITEQESVSPRAQANRSASASPASMEARQAAAQEKARKKQEEYERSFLENDQSWKSPTQLRKEKDRRDQLQKSKSRSPKTSPVRY